MNPDGEAEHPNVQQAVPFFMVSNLEASLRFYIDGLGFRKPKSGSTTEHSAGAGSSWEPPPSCSRSTAPIKSPHPS